MAGTNSTMDQSLILEPLVNCTHCTGKSERHILKGATKVSSANRGLGRLVIFLLPNLCI